MAKGAEGAGPAQGPEPYDQPPAGGTAPLAMPYYLADFHEVLRAVETRYGFLLLEAERAYITQLRALSQAAQMLYVRLVNRRGPWFRVDGLRYGELPDLMAPIAELQAAGLLACDAAAAVLDPEAVLACFTLPELAADLRAIGMAAPRRRPELVAWLIAWPDLPGWLASLLARCPVIGIAPAAPWPFLRFLYFGELRANLSDFVVRDLGYVVIEDRAADQLTAKFPTRRHAEDAFRMAQLYEAFRAIRDRLPPRETLSWWQAQAVDRASLAAGTDLFDRLTDRLGRRLERAKDDALALALYASGSGDTARERQVRLLLRSGRTAEASALAQAMADAPRTTEEAYAARHLLRRIKGTGTGASDARRRQKLGRPVLLEDGAAPVEAATLAHYRARGWDGVHSENWIWLTTFGLLFWDIIHDPAQGMFHSPLQIGPSDLYTAGFYTRRQRAFEERLGKFDDQSNTLAQLRETAAGKNGLTNPFVPWQEEAIACAVRLVTCLPGRSLAAVMRRIAQDIKHHSRGFPDLFLWRGPHYNFVEVKSETDQLSPAQYEWLAFFEDLGLPVFIDNVRRGEPGLPPHAAAH